MTDETLAESLKRLTLTYESDLVCSPPDDVSPLWRIGQGKAGGLAVNGETELEAWTKALEAAQARIKWRARLAERRINGA